MSKEKILLVEDDSFLSNMYATKLELEGYEVDIAEDGEVGYEKAVSGNPDVVLLDIMLPKLDGFGVLEKMKSNASTQNIPVILLTNLSQNEDIQKGLALGANDYLVKAHFMPSEVVAKIKKLISGEGQTKQEDEE